MDTLSGRVRTRFLVCTVGSLLSPPGSDLGLSDPLGSKPEGPSVKSGLQWRVEHGDTDPDVKRIDRFPSESWTG